MGVSLLLQKRLAASVLKCGRRKIWLDPNEVNEISMANSREHCTRRPLFPCMALFIFVRLRFHKRKCKSANIGRGGRGPRRRYGTPGGIRGGPARALQFEYKKRHVIYYKTHEV